MLPTVPGFCAWAGLRDGSRLLATRITLDNKTLRLTTLGDKTLAAPADDLVWLQPLGPRAVYLSDLKPAEYRYVPYLALRWPYHADRSVLGRWLRCRNTLYLKGLGMHSAARLSYDLAGPYERFEAALGIDDETAGGGSVQFRVFVDDRLKYTSPILRGGDRPEPISIRLAGAKRLDLVVEFADAADVLDHADWLDARLIK